jgi:hypothetical protein
MLDSVLERKNEANEMASGILRKEIIQQVYGLWGVHGGRTTPTDKEKR